MPTPDEILKVLSTVNDPELQRDLVSLGMIKDLSVAGDRVQLTLELTTPACPMRRFMQDEIRAALARVPGVGQVEINVTARVPSATSAAPDAAASLVPGVKNIIAVGAGKGGVGKSTVAVYLALALQRSGARVGLLDADFYGPSIPRMLGVFAARPEAAGEQGDRLSTISAAGLKLMSIGFLVDPGHALAWRGPMIHNALRQLLADVDWGDLDYLLVDLPPGTGDVHLSLVQLAAVTGAVVVSTPQEVALQDAVKAVALYQQTGTEILGLVENMSYFTCPHCHQEAELFGRHTVARAALNLGVPYLGDLPLNLAMRASGDLGNPAQVLDTDAAAASAVETLAGKVAAQISIRLATRPAPKLLAVRKH